MECGWEVGDGRTGGRGGERAGPPVAAFRGHISSHPVPPMSFQGRYELLRERTVGLTPFAAARPTRLALASPATGPHAGAELLLFNSGDAVHVCPLDEVDRVSGTGGGGRGERQPGTAPRPPSQPPTLHPQPAPSPFFPTHLPATAALDNLPALGIGRGSGATVHRVAPPTPRLASRDPRHPCGSVHGGDGGAVVGERAGGGRCWAGGVVRSPAPARCL